MNNVATNSIIETARKHVQRIEMAMTKLAPIFPLSAARVAVLTDDEIMCIELLTARFTKLQDHMGEKLFTAFFECVGESVPHLTVIDKLHKLERLQLIDEAEKWLEMRRLCNHLAHEYPEDHDLTAQYLNQIYVLTPDLLRYFYIISNKMLSLATA